MPVARAVSMATMRMAVSLPVRMTMVVGVPVVMIVIMVVRGGVRRS